MPIGQRDTQSAEDAQEVTPSDTTALRRESRGIYTGSGGDIAVKMVSGRSVTFAGTPAGAVLPLQCSHVLSTGTVATDIVALY